MTPVRLMLSGLVFPGWNSHAQVHQTHPMLMLKTTGFGGSGCTRLIRFLGSCVLLVVWGFPDCEVGIQDDGKPPLLFRDAPLLAS